MLEEFHGNGINGEGAQRKLLYGWGTISANVWLPSLIELVGIDTNKFYEPYGCYYPAMQGMNLTERYHHVDAQGGDQFAYCLQHNADGFSWVWDMCAQQASWLRSSRFDFPTQAWRLYNGGGYGSVATESLAVHPARRSKFHIPQTGFRCRNDR